MNKDEQESFDPMKSIYLTLEGILVDISKEAIIGLLLNGGFPSDDDDLWRIEYQSQVIMRLCLISVGDELKVLKRAQELLEEKLKSI